MALKKRSIITLVLIFILVVVLSIAVYLIVSGIDRSKNDIGFTITENPEVAHAVDIKIDFDVHKSSFKYYKIITESSGIYSDADYIEVKKSSITITGIDYNCFIVGRIINKKEVIVVSRSIEDLVNQGFKGIWTEEDFYNIKNDLSINYQLKIDINLENINFNPIGNSAEAFTGIFDGGWHTIKNFKADGNSNEYFGLFRNNKGTIKNLFLLDVKIINAGLNSGCLVGINSGLIENCTVSGSIDGNCGIGGIVGENTKSGILRYLSNAANVTADGVLGDSYSAGGILGNNKGLIEYCRNEGEIYAKKFAAGIAAENGGTIRYGYNVGKIKAETYAGGLAGRNYGGIVSYCYNYGEIKSSQFSAGIAGNLGGGIIEFCYNAFLTDGGIAGCLNENPQSVPEIRNCVYLSGREAAIAIEEGLKDGIDYIINNVAAKTESEMKEAETYTELGFDFDRIFLIDKNGKYPFPQFIKFWHE